MRPDGAAAINSKIVLDAIVVKYYIVVQLGNNNILGNIMHEKEIVNELEKSLKKLIPIPGLRIIIESSRARQWDIVAKFDYQGLCFDIIVEVVAANSLPVFRNKINKLKSSAADEFSVPVLAAPYLSPEKQAFCRDGGIFFIDLSVCRLRSQFIFSITETIDIFIPVV